MIDDSIAFVKQKFSEYYHENIQKILMPTSFEKREFGFESFKEGMMIRHKGFKNRKVFDKFLKILVPSNIYYSAAYYNNPEESMAHKDWICADLVFDIDSDHIHAPCLPNHYYWICLNCQNIVRKPGVNCKTCGYNKFKKETWLCEICLEKAKDETLKLLDFLMKDFGFSSEDIKINFSGHRGYHVHVEEENVIQLGQIGRKEIVDYIKGIGLNVEYHGLLEIREKRMKEIVGPDLNDVGWRAKIARGVYDFLLTTTKEQLEKVGVKKSILKKILANRDFLLEVWSKKSAWGAIKGIDLKTWEMIVQNSIKEQTASIDTVVTTDIHRLIRMPLTLHGKTGFKAIPITIDNLDTFDPFSDSIAFNKGRVRIYTNEVPKFRVGNEIFGPFNNQMVELPIAAA
ncbi:MAG: DNA primase small subunit PriS, partial [Candidatus Bathyarchaeota archaeon]